MSELLEEVRRDPIVAFLLRNSMLTEAQLDTILAAEIDGNLDYKRGLREKGKVTKGAFARTLLQGRSNIESSLYTLFLLAYLNLVPSENFVQLSRTTRMLGELKDAAAQREDQMRVVEAMEEFVRNFGRDRTSRRRQE